MGSRHYSPLKVFAFPEHAQASPALRVPVHVRIKPINACNHSCWFCAYRADDVSLGETMRLRDRIPFEKLMEIAGDLTKMGVRAVTFSGGGEPLLYPRIAEIVERLGTGGVRVASLTNGTYLCGEVADAFADFGTWVRVSMDGWDDASYQRFRRTRPGEFTRILGNMAAFAARKSRCTLGVSFIVSRDNARHLYELGMRVAECGVRHVKVSPCVIADDAGENNAYHDPIRAVVREQIEALRAHTGAPEIVDHYHRFEDAFAKPYASCPMLEYLVVIGADSCVYTCQDKAYRPSGLLGSIAERSFAAFWKAPQTARRIAEIDPSSDCRHHCVAHQKNLLLHEFRGLDPEHCLFV